MYISTVIHLFLFNCILNLFYLTPAMVISSPILRIANPCHFVSQNNAAVPFTDRVKIIGIF